MIFKKHYITFLTLLVWCFSFAQQFTNYTVDDGLPSNHVYTILQDVDGYMWFLTDKGVSKYNGNTFKNFTTREGLPQNDIWEGLTTPDGKFWYLTKSTQLGYIYKNEISSFETAREGEIMNPIFTAQTSNDIYPTGHFNSYELKDGKWALIDNEANNQMYNYILHHHNVNHLLLKPTDSVLRVFDKKHNQIKTHKVSADAIIFGHKRGQINDSLYFQTSNKDYFILNLNTLQIRAHRFEDQIGIESVRFPNINMVNDKIQITGEGFVGILNNEFHIENVFLFPENIKAHFGLIDQQETIWLSSFNHGVYKLPKHRSEVSYFFKDEIVQSITEDKEQIHVGVFNKGIYSYDPPTSNFDLKIPVQDYIYHVQYIDSLNTTFHLTDHNVFSESDKVIKKEVFKLSFPPFSKDEYDTKKLIYHNEKLYTHGHNSIKRLNFEKSVVEKIIKIDGVNDIILFENQVLIATTDGLKKLDHDVVKEVTLNPVLNKSIVSMKQLDDKRLLLNTDGFGSFITDLNTIENLKGSEFLIVQDAFIDKDAIWLGTNNGVKLFTKHQDRFSFERDFDLDDGLLSNDVRTIHVTDDNLMVGTDKGLAVIPIHQKSKDLFIDVYVNEISYGNNTINESINSALFENDTSLQVSFSTIDYNESRSNSTYYYKLEPVHAEWQNASTNEVNFYNLKPDEYTLHYKVNDTLKKIKFSISPRWWQILWIQILIGFIFIALLVVIVWLVTKQLQKKKNQKLFQEKHLSDLQLKALRSQMNPHFVFNSLSAIQYYINKNDTEASEKYLVKFSKLIRQFFELSKETEITLDKELILISNYLDIEKLRFKDKFNYHINVAPEINSNQELLPTMLLQPIVENAVNHGIFNKVNNGIIEINFSQHNDKLVVKIIDDGVGYVNTKIRSRAKKVKSTNVLSERLKFLNKSGQWHITYAINELHPEKTDKGNISTFTIKRL